MFPFFQIGRNPIFYRTRVVPLLLVFFMTGFQGTTAQDKNMQSAGDILLISLPTLALSSTIIKGDSEGTMQFTEGFLLNQGVTMVLKYVTDKERPFGNGHWAFPSGHTSTTFQAASFVQRRYGWAYGIPAYTLAGFTGFSRLNARKHDGWDVLAGALIGVSSTYLFTTPWEEEHLELTFSGGDNEYLLGFRYRF